MRGEIKKVSSLFEKYKQILIAPESTVINAFIEVVDDLLGIKCSRTQLSYSPSTKTLSLRGAGMLRSELKLHEEEILSHLKGRLGEKGAPKLIL